MRMNREAFLATLEGVSPGIAKREQIEQSSCFVFKGGRVITFNDEVACSKPCDVGFEGAVVADKLIAILSRMSEDEVLIEPGDNAFIVRGKKKQADVNMDPDITLPVDAIEQPKEWMPLPEEFNDAVAIVQQCASSDESGTFSLTCVHVTPGWVEACDNFQMTRFPVETPIGKPRLVKRESLRHITGLKMTEIAETKTWLHFRNPEGLTFGCRHHSDTNEFPDMGPVMRLTDGMPITLPGGLAEAVARAEVFSEDNAVSNNVTVMIKKDSLRIMGEGSTGRFREQRTVKYDGPPFAFKIGPKLLVEITKRHNECFIGAKPNPKLKVDTGRFQYVACLLPNEEETR